MTTPTFIKSFAAAVKIDPYIIVAAAADQQVTPATSATDLVIGVANEMGAEAGTMLDVVQGGWGEVRVGGDIDFGDPLTCDANGRAVKAVPAAGSVVRLIGVAMFEGASGDIAPYLVAPGILNTPA